MANTKPILTLSPAAVARVLELMNQAENPVLGVRVGTETKGCSGMVYKLDYVTEERREDLKIEQDGAVVYVDPSATLYVFGSEMDFITSELEQRFVFNNPNAKGSCGCGESFHV